MTELQPSRVSRQRRIFQVVVLLAAVAMTVSGLRSAYHIGQTARSRDGASAARPAQP